MSVLASRWLPWALVVALGAGAALYARGLSGTVARHAADAATLAAEVDRRVAENAELQAALQARQAADPTAHPAGVGGAVVKTPTGGAARPEPPPRCPTPPEATDLVASTTPDAGLPDVMLRRNDPLELRLDAVELDGRASRLVGGMSVWRMAPGQPTKLGAGGFDVPWTEAPAAYGWGVGLAADLGGAYGLAVAPPPLPLFGVSWELTTRATYGTELRVGATLVGRLQP